MTKASELEIMVTLVTIHLTPMINAVKIENIGRLIVVEANFRFGPTGLWPHIKGLMLPDDCRLVTSCFFCIRMEIGFRLEAPFVSSDRDR